MAVPKRRWKIIAAGVLTVALVAGAVGWRLMRFDAPTRTVADSAFRLRVQDGVPAEQAEGIAAGLRAQHQSLRSVTGTGIARPVEVRVSWSQGCQFGLGPTSVSTAWAQLGFICLNAAHPTWKTEAARFRYFPAYVAAHESVHAWQAELGCYHAAEDHHWQWLFEGMADHLAFTALERAGLVTDAQTDERIRVLGGLDAGLGNLRDYETPQPRTSSAYPLFHLGARVMARTGADGRGFADFCRADAAGTDWRTAFADAFGLPVDELYARVERERNRLATGA